MSGQRGPVSAPAEVHRLFGDPSKLGAKLSPQKKPEVGAPAMPTYLGDRAKAEWRRITRELERVGLVTALDRAVLAVYCQAVGEFEAVEDRLQELTGFVDVETLRTVGVDALVDCTPSGYRQIGVLLQARDRAADRLTRAAREFGLTPAARMRVLSMQQPSLFDDEGDPMAAFLQAGSTAARVA